jgi:hypothetical protein
VRIDELANIEATSIILLAPNGNKYKVTVGNTGTLSTSLVT